MRLSGLRRERTGGATRIVADVAFEDAPLPPRAVAFEVDDAFADGLRLSADPFLVGLLPAASWAGERRIAVEGTVCGVLRANLDDHARVLAHWYARCREPAIEPSGGWEVGRPVTPPRAGLMFSGGVDALATLRQHRLDVPLDLVPPHPAAVRDGIVVFGLSVRHAPGGVEDPARRRAFDAHVARLRAFGATAGLEMVPVRTNLLQAYPSWEAWREAGFGAGTVAAAHALAGRLSEVTFSSTGGGPGLGPHGSHPLLDDRLSSGALRVAVGLPYRTRFEKVRLVAGWPEGLAVLHPCLLLDDLAPGVVNCGRCEKCLRTLLALEACGALADAPTFRGCVLTPEAVRKAPRPAGLHLLYGDDLVAALAARGRADLADVVRGIMTRGRMTRWQRRRHRWRHSVAKRWGRWFGGPRRPSGPPAVGGP